MKLAKMDFQLEIKENQEFSYQKASLMQGVLMEWLDSEYAGKLHQGGWNPYAQHIEKINGEWHWIITTFEDEAYQNICSVLMEREQEEIVLKYNQQKIAIRNKKLELSSSEQLMNQYYFQDAPRNIKIHIVTPMAFKQRGSYVFYPDMRCMIQSMIHKYDAVTSREGEIDEQILEELVKNIYIQQYNLKSCRFHLEGVRIPAFIGEIQFGFHGSQTLINYMHFLFHFASYSGIGIKTAMGMGAIDVQERER